MRAIFVCKNKACGHRWAIEYPKRRKVQLGYGRTEWKRYRLDAHQREREPGHDAACPECGRHTSKFGVVVGVRTEAPCDTRCTDATGFRCECSCGGANHGESWLTREQAMVKLTCTGAAAADLFGLTLERNNG